MRRLGVVFVPKDDTRDIFEVAGFDADILAAFSKRRAEIEASLTELRLTLQDAQEAEAADLARAGKVKDALIHLSAAGRVSEAKGADAYTEAVSRWMSLRLEGRGHPIVTRDNATRRTLNELCQSLLLDAGKIEAPMTYGPLRLGVGDGVLAQRTDRTLTAGPPGSYIRNGARGRVIAAGSGSATVNFDGIGTIELPAAWLARGGADLAYCVTSYAVQGATQPTSTSVIAAGANLPELVVDITRGKTDNHVILIDKGDSELSRWRIGPEDLLEEVAGSIRSLDLTPRSTPTPPSPPQRPPGLPTPSPPSTPPPKPEGSLRTRGAGIRGPPASPPRSAVAAQPLRRAGPRARAARGPRPPPPRPSRRRRGRHPLPRPLRAPPRRARTSQFTARPRFRRLARTAPAPPLV